MTYQLSYGEATGDSCYPPINHGQTGGDNTPMMENRGLRYPAKIMTIRKIKITNENILVKIFDKYLTHTSQ